MTTTAAPELSVDRLAGEVAAAFYFEDLRPLYGAAALLDWRMNGCLTAQLLAGTVQGRLGEDLLVANNGKLAAERVLFVGGGRWRQLDAVRLQALLGQLLTVCRRAGFSRIALGLTQTASLSPETLQAAVTAAVAAAESPCSCLLAIDDDDPDAA